jgi:hypothetical protein
MKSYASDTKWGPANGNTLVVKEQNQNLVRYEFGPCLYLAYLFGFIQLCMAGIHIFTNPFSKTEKEENEIENFEEQEYLENYIYT